MGQSAEAHKDYDTAFEDYQHALNLKPNDLPYKESFARMRFQAAAAHVDRGRVLRQNGDLNAALAEFTHALQIDPSYETAQQEMDQVQQQLATPPTGPGPELSEQMSRQNETLASIASISGPVELKPISNDPITLHMVEDVKIIYQAIGKATGINILFDPDYTSKRIPVDLTNVSWADALRIVGTLAGTFYKPVRSRRAGRPDLLSHQRQPAERCQRSRRRHPQSARPQHQDLSRPQPERHRHARHA
jgi:general secretion pathway protein D